VAAPLPALYSAWPRPASCSPQHTWKRATV
jgi:hypothetical protein